MLFYFMKTAFFSIFDFLNYKIKRSLMKIKPILSFFIGLTTFSFIACDDDLRSIGDSIQPPSDGIFVGVDTFFFSAETIKWDSVYARTTKGLLGEYNDAVFGNVKSDYLSELYCPRAISFEDRVVSIDSVRLYLEVSSYVGDTISPFGVSVYEVNKKLDRNFYTNIDPSNYCNLSKVIGRNTFSLSQFNFKGSSTYKYKIIPIPLDKSIGEAMHKEYTSNPGTFTNTDALREFFPGIYVTSTLGSDALMDIEATAFAIYYSYWGRNSKNTADSLYTNQAFTLSVTPEVIQMNHVEHNNIDDLTVNQKDKSFLKTPAGVYTQLTIPLSKIASRVGKDTTVNAANFTLTGLTEAEQFSGFNRPSRLLFINKDSVDNFFSKKQLPDNITSFLVSHTSTGNLYSFGNIANLFNHYLNKFREDANTNISDLKYILIPISEEVTTTISSSGTQVVTTKYVSNLMRPSSSVLRTDAQFMKLPMVFSKYNTRN